MVPLDITGERYGRLTAIERVRTPGDRHTKWRFICDCGQETIAHLDAVRAGATQSCGCFRVEKTRARSITHGHSIDRTDTPEISAWQHAKSRCFNPNDKKYPIYGGRGITMCPEWANDAAVFLAAMGPRPKGTTLDRIDVDGDYGPGNCRWATPRQQTNNRRTTLHVEVEGRRLPMAEYARERGISYKALWSAVRGGDDVLVAANRLASR